MREYNHKKKIAMISSIITILPLPFLGLILWFYSQLFTGIFFYVLLPIALLICFILYIVFLIGFSVLIYKMHPPIKEGTFNINSEQMDSWLMAQIVLNIIDMLRLLRIPPAMLRKLYSNVFNTKIGDLLIMSGIVEFSLVDIGDNTVVGNNSEIWGHMIEGNKIYIKRVKIGKNCTIGAKSLIMPGVRVGNGTIVGACSLVPKNKKLEPNSLYLGVPVRKIKDL